MQALEDTTTALGQPVFLRKIGTASAPSAAIARWRHGPMTVEVAPSTSIRLALSLVERRNARKHRNGDSDHSHGASVSIFSPSEGVCVEVTGEADVVQVFLEQSSAETAVGTPFTCPPLYGLQDDGLRMVILRMLVDSTRHPPSDDLAFDQALYALAHRIRRHAAGRQPSGDIRAPMFRGGLSPTTFRRVEAMIDGALDTARSPTLAEMAAIAGLSVTHFLRAFRRHTGSTPHKYLVGRRINRALSLLRDRRIAIGDVAEQVGFATSAHFVASFHSTLGVTPGLMREALAA
jgi:AraC family transcriptional regulator